MYDRACSTEPKMIDKRPTSHLTHSLERLQDIFHRLSKLAHAQDAELNKLRGPRPSQVIPTEPFEANGLVDEFSAHLDALTDIASILENQLLERNRAFTGE